MKNVLAITAILASTSTFAFYGNDGDSNFSGYGDGNNNFATSGAGTGKGKFSMSINAEGQADMAGNAVNDTRTGVYGQGYRQPYYGYTTPYYGPAQ